MKDDDDDDDAQGHMNKVAEEVKDHHKVPHSEEEGASLRGRPMGVKVEKTR